jgi:hypothetical protein
MRRLFALVIVFSAASCTTLFPESPDAPATADAPTSVHRADARTTPIDADAPVQTGDCPAAPDGASATTLSAYARVTELRQIAGLPCATFVPALDTSSAKHSAYYLANQGDDHCVADPHAEVSGCSMFVAARFDAREVAAGYGGSPRFETMVFGSGASGGNAVQIWVDSVWHRTPILSPWVRDFGYGDAAGVATMDFGVGDATPSDAFATWPADGQTDVPTSFAGNTEEPTPPVPPGGWPSGYPITIYLKGTVTSAVLVREGDATTIASQAFGPGDAVSMGLLANDYFIYANEPLVSGTLYHVHADTSRGAVDFSFTTR